MGGYATRRLLLAVPTLLGLSLLIFLLVKLAPGDPAEVVAARSAPGGEATPQQVAEVRRQLGLDRPVIVQYGRWLGGALHADLGRSYRGTGVSDMVRARLPATVQLALAAFLLSVLLGLPLGVVAAMLQGRWSDHVTRLVALVGASVPVFFFAYLLVDVFAVRLHLLPVAGRERPEAVLLPALTLAVGPTALVSRLLRSSLLDVLAEGYMETARAKGLAWARVVIGHGVRNAAIPVVTVLGGILARLLEGAVIVEVVFSWPGLGKLTFDALVERDYPVVQGVVMFAGAVFVAMNLMVDLSYSVLDPRVRLGGALERV